MNKKDVESIRERISELTRKYEDNRAKILQLQREIIQLQQEVQRLLEIDHSLRGGITELNRLVPPEEKPQEEDPDEA